MEALAVAYEPNPSQPPEAHYTRVSAVPAVVGASDLRQRLHCRRRCGLSQGDRTLISLRPPVKAICASSGRGEGKRFLIWQNR